jgi:NDP-sugar pyrophosphorylase family protein
MGLRLGAHTSVRPKCLLPVNGTPILVNALRHLEAAGIRQTALVVGYRDSDIRAVVGDRLGAMAIGCHVNAEYHTTGTSRSLAIGLAAGEGDVLVLEGDVFFEPRVLSALLAQPHADATVVEPWRPDLDGSVVTVGPSGVVGAWIHKKDRPPAFILEGTFKTVNLHRFSAGFVSERLRGALAAQVAMDGGREPIETVFAHLVREGARIQAIEAPGRWAEIDNEADLAAAQALFHRTSDGHR